MNQTGWRWAQIGVCFVAKRKQAGSQEGLRNQLGAEPSRYDLYCRELLDHAGLFYQEIDPHYLTRFLPTLSLLVTIGSSRFSQEEREAVKEFVVKGGVWIAIGSTCGCDELFGVQTERNPFADSDTDLSLGEGYLCAASEQSSPPEGGDKGIDLSLGEIEALHFFGGVAVRPATGKVLGVIQDAHGRPTPYAAIVHHRVEQGWTLLFAVHLGKTISTIRQGRAVTEDGIAPSDGSALLEDGVLRAEDGIVLDWYSDRSPSLQQAQERWLPPYFKLPIADCWYALFLRAMFQAVQSTNTICPLLWYYPRHLNALGLLSFDSNNEEPEKILHCLHFFALIGARATWCIQPPGYPLNLYRELRRREHEIGLCFALDLPGNKTAGALHMQREQIRRNASLSDLGAVRLKELRWRGGTQIYEWCDQVGLQVELGRGGYSLGTGGFAFGSCHPWKPLHSTGEFARTYVIPLLLHEVGTRSPFPMAYELLEQAIHHYGIAHFSLRPEVTTQSEGAEELRRLVGHGRLKGMEWWTAKEIIAWEEGRRKIYHRLIQQEEESWELQLTAPVTMEDFSLLLLCSFPPQLQLGGRVLTPRSLERYGIPFYAFQFDLPEKRAVSLILRR